MTLSQCADFAKDYFSKNRDMYIIHFLLLGENTLPRFSLYFYNEPIGQIDIALTIHIYNEKSGYFELSSRVTNLKESQYYNLLVSSPKWVYEYDSRLAEFEDVYMICKDKEIAYSEIEKILCIGDFNLQEIEEL